ncbi:MAG: sulfatase-like hydrolase/transferase [Edaphobacter sp.]
MDRRSFLRSAGAAGIAATASGVAATMAAAEPQKANKAPIARRSGSARRQSVILMTDATRRDMLNCYKLTGVQTPNLDRLAAEGVRFERAYTTQPVGTSARSAIFTGLYPHTNGCWGNSMPLGNTVHTIGQRLNDKGVHCGYIGKWNLDGFDSFGTGKPAPGWDPACWYDQRNYLEELTPEDRRRSREAKTSNDPKLQAGFTFAHRCSSRAVDFIAKHKDEDFLLVVSYDEPRDPSVAPANYSDLYKEYSFPRVANVDDMLKDKPEEQIVWADGDLNKPVTPIRDPQLFGALTFVDSEIGRVLDEIDRSTPGAMVLYTSDHGGMLKSHHLHGSGPAMYEEITNVPLLVRWKDHAPKNTASHVPMSHIDISGTMMEYFGFEIPKVLEGGSMLATIQKPDRSSREDVFIEWGRYGVDRDGFGGFQPIRCICDGRYKLSIHLLSSDELYDLKEDYGEMNNLIASEEHAELRNRMHDTLLDWMDSSRDPFRGYYWGRREWRKDYPVSWENHGMIRQREQDGNLPRELDRDTGLPMKEATRAQGKGNLK